MRIACAPHTRVPASRNLNTCSHTQVNHQGAYRADVDRSSPSSCSSERAPLRCIVNPSRPLTSLCVCVYTYGVDTRTPLSSCSLLPKLPPLPGLRELLMRFCLVCLILFLHSTNSSSACAVGDQGARLRSDSASSKAERLLLSDSLSPHVLLPGAGWGGGCLTARLSKSSWSLRSLLTFSL